MKILQNFLFKYYFILLIYLLTVSISAFIMFGVDKQKAKKHKWRIPEHDLILVSILGGSIGAYLGMKLFRHKTKHKKFTVGIPCIIIIQIVIFSIIIFS